MTSPRANVTDDLRARTAERSRTAAQRAAQKAKRRRAWPRWAVRSLRAGLIVLPVALTGATGAWLWQSGWIATAGERMHMALIDASAEAGFRIREVFVEGREETDPTDVIAALGIRHGDPIFDLDLDRARSDLESLPWIATAAVERRLPDTIYVRLSERRPMALWQRDGQLVLIDTDGVLLSDHDLGQYRTLPILVGKDAPNHAGDLLKQLRAVPSVAKRVEAAIRVGDRRWDLKLDNGVTVRLPENGLAAALKHLAELEAQSALLDRDIVAIDLRLPNRLVIQTSAAAAQQRRLPEEKI